MTKRDRKVVVGRAVEVNKCGCDCCDEFDCECDLTDQEIEEIKMISEFAEDIIENDLCEDCVFEVLLKVFTIGKEIGFDDARDLMSEILGDLEWGWLDLI
jgi:hypothetical protein